MSGLGNTTLGNESPVKKFLSPHNSNEDSTKHNVRKAVVLSKEQSDQLELVKLAIGNVQDSAALRYCFDEFWKDHGTQITEKAMKIKEILS